MVPYRVGSSLLFTNIADYAVQKYSTVATWTDKFYKPSVIFMAIISTFVLIWDEVKINIKKR